MMRPFWALGVRGSEAEDPKLPKAGRKACVGPETNAANPGSHCTPNQTHAAFFLRFECVALRGEPEEASQPPV